MAKYINADDLMKTLEIKKNCEDCKYCGGGGFTCLWAEDDMVWVCDKIVNFPAADVRENKRGKWIMHPEVKNIYG